MKHVGDKIQAFVAGELSGAEQKMVADHLAQCPECATAVAEARQLWDLLETADVPQNMPAESAWTAIQARTFGRSRSALMYGGGTWSKTGIAATALAAGLAVAILLPGDGASNKISASEKVAASDSEASWGSSFWLDEQSDSGFSEMLLTAATEGSDS